jgi:transcription initiation factor TFIID subunit 6
MRCEVFSLSIVMSIFQKEWVQQIAEKEGYNIKEELCSVLVQDVEYRLREIIHVLLLLIQESVKFKRHSKRKQLVPQDINSALLVKNVHPLYGYLHKSEFRQANGVYYLEDYELDVEEIVNKVPGIDLAPPTRPPGNHLHSTLVGH